MIKQDTKTISEFLNFCLSIYSQNERETQDALELRHTTDLHHKLPVKLADDLYF